MNAPTARRRSVEVIGLTAIDGGDFILESKFACRSGARQEARGTGVRADCGDAHPVSGPYSAQATPPPASIIGGGPLVAWTAPMAEKTAALA